MGSDSTAVFYSGKGFSSILLNRMNSAVGPTGVYTCLIPDAGNVLRFISVTIVDNSKCNFRGVDKFFRWFFNYSTSNLIGATLSTVCIIFSLTTQCKFTK